MSMAPSTRYRALALAVAVMVTALAAAPTRAKADPDAAVVTMAGRTATITLPYRTSNHLIWVSATRVIDAVPFSFKALAIKPDYTEAQFGLGLALKEKGDKEAARVELKKACQAGIKQACGHLRKLDE